ncbi:FMN reductase [Agrococcus sp. SGAir0287]|uniref:FMN reductase n=1 Tax=Agrococcus sp. SGAir0287 TaxID=2070347 RepID=UPI0010CD324C|nr:FMN reductase [Agrococcus sp. SGAir0287]QCR18848.1 FMN reductase [Agrococcus sp. SGAir0287]
MSDTFEPPLRVVGVNGSLQSPSKTGVLLDAVLAAIGERATIEPRRIDLASIASGFAGAVSREGLSPEVEDALAAVEAADVLVVGTPIYRASFTGLFKHFFDFVEQRALVDTPVLLTATGGSERHTLTIEHQLRPLFGFFQALTLPTGVYGSAGDFADGRVASPALLDRIDAAVSRSLPLVAHRVRPTVPARW